MALVKRRVNLTLTSSMKNGKRYHKLIMNPLDIRLQSTKEEVVWNCKGASFAIAFKAASPFNALPPGADGLDLPSGQSTTGINGPYPYQIVLNPTDGSSVITIDPEVVVDDTTPPPGGQKLPVRRMPTRVAKKLAARRRPSKGRKKK